MPRELETDSFFAIGSLLRPLVLHDHLQTGNNLLKNDVHFGDGVVDDVEHRFVRNCRRSKGLRDCAVRKILFFFVPKIERERKIDKAVLKYDLYYSKL